MKNLQLLWINSGMGWNGEVFRLAGILLNIANFGLVPMEVSRCFDALVHCFGLLFLVNNNRV